MQENDQLVPNKAEREFDSEEADDYSHSELEANDPKHMDKSYSEVQIS